MIKNKLFIFTLFFTIATIRPVEIIELSPDRWQEFKQLRLSALKELPLAFGIDLEDELNKGDEYWKNLLLESKKNNSVWLLFAQENNQLIGMIGAEREEGTYLKHLVWIKKVYVSPQSRSKKIGHALLQTLIKVLENTNDIQQLLLWVTCDLSSAVALYKNNGFEIVGTLHRGIKIGDRYFDNYLMEKSVKQRS